MLEDAGGEFAEEQSAVLLWGAFDAAVAEEGVKLLSEGVEVVGEAVGEEVSLHHLNRLGEAEQVEAERDFGGVVNCDAIAIVGLDVDFALDASHADIGVEQKDGGVAFETEHAVVAEGVVLHAVAGEVGILEGANAEDMGEMVDLIGSGAALDENGAGLGDGLGEEVGELLGVAGAGLKLLAIGAEDEAEADVVRLNLGPTCELCSPKNHLHVEALAGVYDDDDALGLLDKDAVADCGHIGGVVVVAAIGLLHHKRYGEPLHKDALGAFRDGDEPLLLELLNHLFQVGVIEGLAALDEVDAEEIVDLLEAAAGDVADGAPFLESRGITRLEANHL